MLDLKLKSLYFILSYIGHEGVAIIEEYNKKSLYPMFIKCHNHLHSMLKFEVNCVDPMD
jgi:hypothetical protein